MIIKNRDATQDVIRAIEQQARRSTDRLARTACISAASRLRDDPTTQYACDLIDGQFADSEQWAVIHDLRLRVNGHAIHINHLLISRALHFMNIDSRYIEYGLDIDHSGQCHAYDLNQRWSIASPLKKASRDSLKLARHIQQMSLIPRTCRFSRKASVRSFVLTNPSLRLSVETPQASQNVEMLSSDALFPLLWNSGFSKAPLLGRLQSAEKLASIANQLAAQHEPAYSVSLLPDDCLANSSTRNLLKLAG